MENDDCFIQVPDENSLERWGQNRPGGGVETKKNREKRSKINGALCRAESDPSGQ